MEYYGRYIPDNLFSDGKILKMKILYLIVLLTFSILIFLFAVTLFFFPQNLVNLNELGNRILYTNEKAIIHRRIAGIVLLILGIIFFAIGYLISLK